MTTEHPSLTGQQEASDFVRAIEYDGFTIIDNVIGVDVINEILNDLESIRTDAAISQRAGKAFGIRNLLNLLPSSRALANSPRLISFARPILADGARVVRGIYFDKNPTANWKVAWHQDLTIAVRQQAAVDGYGSWSIKAGIHHVQPPVSVLERMLTIRLHLDDTDEFNGALHVLPGSHKCGRLEAKAIQEWREKREPVICPVAKGGVMLMRPLLLHASSQSLHPTNRRVLHFEYSSFNLPNEIAWYDT